MQISVPSAYPDSVETVSFTDETSGMGDKVMIEFNGNIAYVWKSEFLRIAKMLAVPYPEDTPHD